MELIKKSVLKPEWGKETDRLLAEWNYPQNAEAGINPLTAFLHPRDYVAWYCPRHRVHWSCTVGDRLAGMACIDCMNE